MARKPWNMGILRPGAVIHMVAFGHFYFIWKLIKFGMEIGRDKWLLKYKRIFSQDCDAGKELV